MWEKIKHKCKRIHEVLREWIWLFRYIKRYRWSVVLYIFLGIVATIMGLVVSVASKDLINAVNAMPKVKEDIIRAAATMIGLAIGQIFFQSCASWVTVNVNTKVTNEIRSEIFLKIMTAQWENLRDFHSGELLNRLENVVFRDLFTISPQSLNALMKEKVAASEDGALPAEYADIVTENEEHRLSVRGRKQYRT